METDRQKKWVTSYQPNVTKASTKRGNTRRLLANQSNIRIKTSSREHTFGELNSSVLTHNHTVKIRDSLQDEGGKNTLMYRRTICTSQVHRSFLDHIRVLSEERKYPIAYLKLPWPTRDKNTNRRVRSPQPRGTDPWEHWDLIRKPSSQPCHTHRISKAYPNSCCPDWKNKLTGKTIPRLNAKRQGWMGCSSWRQSKYQIELRYGKEVRIIGVKDENYDYPACLHQLDTS